MTWELYKRHAICIQALDITIDLSHMGLDDDFLNSMQDKIQKALIDMQALENGDIVNTDENRMVGHYWLRNSDLAPSQSIKNDIKNLKTQIEDFVYNIHSGSIQGANGPFTNILCVGIGGSALGPQFASEALGDFKTDKMRPYFIDNTDPDGIDIALSKLEGQLGQTLCIITSKSGSTPEPKNVMHELEQTYKKANLNFSDHAVAITSIGSQLDHRAQVQGWLNSFPMWDWVGGRTSELGAVGLVPAALQGINISRFLEGAKKMDEITRIDKFNENPALMLALAWYKSGNGQGKKDMVILPYKDRLMLFSRYLQQLVMESLGKELDKEGKKVHQGIAVYGNKGSTDQHAYVQQLRDGINNFFVTFIEVLKDRNGNSLELESGNTCGDYLQAFLLGTAQALSEKKRLFLTISIKESDPASIGALIALYERAVGYYASFVNINAYHQPGVEAGKKAAVSLLSLKQEILNKLKESSSKAFTAEQLAKELNKTNQLEYIYKLLKHAAANKNVLELPKTPFYESEFICIRS